MKCSEMIDLIARRLEGALSDQEARALDAHLLECSACRAELRLQQTIEECLRVPPTAALSPDFGARVARRVFAQARREERERRIGYIVPVVANAIVLVLAILYRGAISEALAPVFSSLGSSLGAATRSMVDVAGAALSHASTQASTYTSAQAGPSSAHLTQILGIVAPIACAAAVLVIASSRIFALRRG